MAGGPLGVGPLADPARVAQVADPPAVADLDRVELDGDEPPVRLLGLQGTALGRVEHEHRAVVPVHAVVAERQVGRDTLADGHLAPLLEHERAPGQPGRRLLARPQRTTSANAGAGAGGRQQDLHRVGDGPRRGRAARRRGRRRTP